VGVGWGGGVGGGWLAGSTPTSHIPAHDLANRVLCYRVCGNLALRPAKNDVSTIRRIGTMIQSFILLRELLQESAKYSPEDRIEHLT
jgi:hypothetical protein